jgi:hypothetical protein
MFRAGDRDLYVCHRNPFQLWDPRGLYLQEKGDAVEGLSRFWRSAFSLKRALPATSYGRVQRQTPGTLLNQAPQNSNLWDSEVIVA